MCRKSRTRATRLSVQKAAYRALINLSGGYLESQGRQLRLVPGMQVNAEIHLGTRSFLEYLLSPVQKVARPSPLPPLPRGEGKCTARNWLIGQFRGNWMEAGRER